METVILCGGKGTRAYPHTLELPKPLLEVDGRPVLGHVMAIYRAQGFRRFVLAAGYKHELVSEFAATLGDGVDVIVRDTGDGTATGVRVARCRDDVGPTFFVTYADGLGDVDLRALLDFHRAHPGAATVTTVPLRSQYGTLDVDGDGRVTSFREKALLAEHRINAGFMVFDRDVFDVWEGDDLEREVLPALAARGELFAYHHEGFWESMDTYKDALELTELCRAGDPPWLRQPGSQVHGVAEPGLPAS